MMSTWLPLGIRPRTVRSVSAPSGFRRQVASGPAGRKADELRYLGHRLRLLGDVRHLLEKAGELARLVMSIRFAAYEDEAPTHSQLPTFVASKARCSASKAAALQNAPTGSA